MMQMEITASIRNTGAYGSTFGSMNQPPSVRPVRSTFPNRSAVTYPAARPTRIESCFFVPFMKICHRRQTRSVTMPITRFGTDPKSCT